MLFHQSVSSGLIKNQGLAVMKKFELKNVVTIRFLWFPLMGALSGLLFSYLFAEFGYRYFGSQGLYLVAIAGFGSIALILYFLKKDLTIWSDRKYLYVESRGKFSSKLSKYPKEGIEGFYSHDYSGERKSKISLQIRFANGKKIEITDLEYRTKDDYKADKRKALASFIQAMQTELSFEKLEKNRLRWVGQMGSHWYSRQ
ncbi:MAG: hypothetical protein LBP24_00330 [Coriobacteriales bacterium]|jgi:hypothetical protein|nr:hypothetical protein [Coriobacteriales bacterium]